MMKKAFAATAAILMGVGLAASPASAHTATHGAYTQETGSLACTGHVQDDGDGGTLYVEVSGYEVRPSDKHFRTWDVRTQIIAQEKNYQGHWVNVAHSGVRHGSLGPAYNYGGVNISDFQWNGDYSPTLHVNVAGFDDLFRAKVMSKVFDDEGARIARLVTMQGQCRL